VTGIANARHPEQERQHDNEPDPPAIGSSSHAAGVHTPIEPETEDRTQRVRRRRLMARIQRPRR